MVDEYKIEDHNLVSRTIAMPADTNANGDIFGGWVLSQMDLGGAVLANKLSSTGRSVTVSVDSMSFINPIHVGDLVSCYAKLIKRGNTSMRIQIQIWTYNYISKTTTHVTHGEFTYVAINEDGRSAPLLPDVAVI